MFLAWFLLRKRKQKQANPYDKAGQPYEADAATTKYRYDAPGVYEMPGESPGARSELASEQKPVELGQKGPVELAGQQKYRD